MVSYCKNVFKAGKTLLACILGYTVTTRTQQGAIWVRYCFTYKQALRIVSLQAKVSAASVISLRGNVVAAAAQHPVKNVAGIYLRVLQNRCMRGGM